MMFVAVLLGLFSTTWCVPLEIHSHWNNFKLSHGRFYQFPQEESHRLQVFQENLRKIEEHNKLYEAGLTTYEMGVTRFADLTDDEFIELTASYMAPLQQNYSLDNVFRVRAGEDIPDSFDWRDKNAVNKVRDQANCGSCWAFTAIECLESIFYIQKGKMLTLSTQNVVDCAGPNGGHGCKGGIMEAAYNYIKENGIMYESDYPYSAVDGECKFKAEKSAVKVTGYKLVEQTEPGLKSAVAKVGPIGVGVDSKEWKLYVRGIFHPKQAFESFTHGAVVVGYGTEDGVDYWILRNSYGQYWGESGYIRVARKGDNDIGITRLPIYPTLE